METIIAAILALAESVEAYHLHMARTPGLDGAIAQSHLFFASQIRKKINLINTGSPEDKRRAIVTLCDWLGLDELKKQYENELNNDTPRYS